MCFEWLPRGSIGISVYYALAVALFDTGPMIKCLHVPCEDAHSQRM